MSDAAVAEFWRRVKKTDTCWLWVGAKRGHEGYGCFRVAIDTPFGRASLQVAAHKIAYALTKGPLAAGLLLRHSCDTPPCVNPDHLIPGTHKQNSGDASERGRLSRYWSKLTDDSVGEMRRFYFEAEMTVGALAKRYSMSKPGVISVLIGETHRTAPGPIGPIRKVVGTKVFGAKLDERKVAEMRGRFIAGETITELGAAFGVVPPTVSKIIRNERWKHVSPMPAVQIRPGHRKLTREQVMKIRQRHSAGTPQARLAADYDVSRAAISMLVNRKTHA